MSSVGNGSHIALHHTAREETDMVLYGKAGPDVFQQWVSVERTGSGWSETRQKFFCYTISRPDARKALKKKMAGFSKQGPEIRAGIDADLWRYLDQCGGVMKMDGELPSPPYRVTFRSNLTATLCARLADASRARMI